jgi:TRAP-type C4-dicarboxylate transport system permease small subunit
VVRALELITNLIVVGFFVFVLVASWEVVMANMARRANTADIPMGYIRMALPLMALASVVFGIELEFKLVRQWLCKKSKDDERDAENVEDAPRKLEIV